MQYQNIVEGIFKDRPNRFVAIVEIDGKEEKVHVNNTGRCKELLVKGCTVYLEDFRERMGSRKLAFSLIAVDKNGLLINMDSQAPNKVVEEALISGSITLPNMSHLISIKREQTFGSSRFDFYVEDDKHNRGYIEVKGVTLENGGIVRFPDAPTERGVKHLKELMTAKKEGYEAFVIFVVQMNGMTEFRPNYETHPLFGETLVEAEKMGVNIMAYQCHVTPSSLNIADEIKIALKK